MSDRVAVMNEGRIEQLDDPQRIYDAPATAFVAGFVGDMNSLTGTRATGDVVKLRDGLELTVGCVLADAAEGARVRVGIRPEHVTVGERVGQEAPATLESVMVVGHELQLVVRTQAGEKVVSRQPRTGDGAQSLEPGMAVSLRFAAGAAFLLALETTAESDPGTNGPRDKESTA
jgi:spermidine/putrescine transport system ATP-binding protein